MQTQILATLKRLCCQANVAVMLITHDIGVIARTADRLAVMYAGRIVELGPTAGVLRAPRHGGPAALDPAHRRRPRGVAPHRGGDAAIGKIAAELRLHTVATVPGTNAAPADRS